MNEESNFKHLEKEFPILYNLGSTAEKYLYSDPNASLFKIRLFGERMVEIVFTIHKLEFPYNDNQFNRLKELEDESLLDENILNLFHSIRKLGNVSAHSAEGTLDQSNFMLKKAFKLSKWFSETYANETTELPTAYITPVNIDYKSNLEKLESEHELLKAKYEKILSERSTEGIDSFVANNFRKKSQRASSKIEMDEAETRYLIDEQLRNAGWEADTVELNNQKFGILPQKGKNMAIAEWVFPNGKRADYALFIGKELYGVIEAKRWKLDISTDLNQSKKYAELAETNDNYSVLGKWGDFKVPFLFSSNGRPYLEQIKTKSGIWFLDARKKTNHPRPLMGWYSPEGLKKLYEKDLDESIHKLQKDDFDYLQDKEGLGLYDFQIKAIKAVEKKVLSNSKERRALVAMATGTGKTRTIIGLCYRFIKSNRFKRILFLVDRTSLGTQAINSFTDNRIEGLNTFADIYKVNELVDKIPEAETRLHFSTVQGMVKRLFFSDEKTLPVDTYDCIIIDEAHRGYLLDKHLGEDDFGFKDQNDYVSKYKKVLSYFDAYSIGLTATPALHTTEIFGDAVFTYSYREAVIEGYLIDYEPPYIIKTELNQNGIEWKKGEQIKVYDKETNEVKGLDKTEDDIKIDVTGFNKKVITRNFNKAVVKVLAKEFDPEGEEKTLIFTANNDHADMLVDLLKEEYQNQGYDIHDKAILKITGSIYDPQKEITCFKKEKYPNIVVTVDLLTTGIDVPAITNLVFLRSVKSRILYEQMLGRATRLCPEINKEVFRIYDAVDIYRNLEDHTNMKPVVTNVKTTFAQLAEEIESIDSEERKEKQIDQIIAKLHRKKNQILDDELEKFKYLVNGKDPIELINELKAIKTNSNYQLITDCTSLWKFLDGLKSLTRYTLYSEHKDVVTDVERGYGNGLEPADYLEEFKEFVASNQNKIAALNIVCTKPSELDRESLKKLRLELDEHGFTKQKLNTAWKEAKNEDIVSDIISFIRTMSLGTPLQSHEKRIMNAVQKARELKEWTKPQLNWLNKIEAQLIKESVLRKEDFDALPFKNDGGFKRLDKIFENKLEDIIGLINENLYIETA